MAEERKTEMETTLKSANETEETLTTPAGEGSKSPEQIEAELERTRGELGDTVAALADKADVKQQAKTKAEETRRAAQEKATEAAEAAKQTLGEAPEKAGQATHRALAGARENPVHVGVAALVVVGVLVLLRRRRA